MAAGRAPRGGKAKAVLGVDVGTSGCKTLVVDVDGNVLGRGYAGYATRSGGRDEAVQDPEEIFSAFRRAIREAVARSGVSPVAVGFSSVWHSVMAVDRRGAPLTPLLTWADNRAVHQAESLRSSGAARRLYSVTGCPVHPLYPLAKLLWLREEWPEVFGQAYKFVSIKEHILQRVFGGWKVDKSVASATGLLDTTRGVWDPTALDLAGIDESRLSTVVSPLTILEGGNRRLLEGLGLEEGTPWVAGAGDGALASLGSGGYGRGVAAASIGTSGAVRVVSEEPKFDPAARTWCYAFTDDLWVIGGAINNGGLVLRWLADEILGNAGGRTQGREALGLVAELAAGVEPGSDGLLFLPFLTGERSPGWNENARGVLLGLGLGHTKAHLVRAAMEGVCFRMYSVYEALSEQYGAIAETRATGGFANSRLWRQMLCDVLGCLVIVPQEYDASAFGAAQLAMVALGLAPDLESLKTMVRPEATYRPYPPAQAVYLAMYRAFKKAYEVLGETFEDLRDLRESGGTQN